MWALQSPAPAEQTVKCLPRYLEMYYGKMKKKNPGMGMKLKTHNEIVD